MASARPACARPSRRLGPLLAIFAVQCGYLVAIYAMAIVSGPPAELVPLDCIALPGGEAILRVIIERQAPPLSRAAFSGASVSLLEELPPEPAPGGGPANGKPPFKAQAGFSSVGLASVALKAPEAPGPHRFRVRVEEPGRFTIRPAEAELILDVIPAGRPVLFVVAPQAVADDGGESLLTGAAQVLQALGRERTIVYVATRRYDDPGRLRAWLEARGFPSGPVLATRAVRAGASLRELMASLDLSRWKGPLWGVAASGRDASALASAGLRVVHVAADVSLEVDERTVFHAGDWNEARKKVEGSR